MLSHISTVSIYVRDQDAARDFYVDKLGFELREEVDGGPFKWIEVAPSGAQTTICIATPDFPVGSEDQVGVHSNMSFDTDDIHGFYETCKARGVEFTSAPERTGYGKWFASFHDLEGNEFFVHQEIKD